MAMMERAPKVIDSSDYEIVGECKVAKRVSLGYEFRKATLLQHHGSVGSLCCSMPLMMCLVWGSAGGLAVSRWCWLVMTGSY